MRALAWLLLMALSGCGGLIDLAYVLSDKRYSEDVTQSKPSGLAEVALVHTVRAEQGQVWLACEDMERNIERTWTVRKTFEHQGGYYRAHLFPVILDTIIAGALTAVFSVKCAEGDASVCPALWGTTPLWVDAVYSAVRLTMIDPPLLVEKATLGTAQQTSSAANWRRTVSCEPDATLIVQATAWDPAPQRFRVDPWGALTDADTARFLRALQAPQAQVLWSAGGKAPVDAGLPRCQALAALGQPCPPPPPSR